jgi:DNA replication initiation complex subunit (GINS family)
MATHYVRQPSHHFKKSQLAHARPGKPVRTKSSSKVVHYKEPAPEEDEDSMAVSFLNYWYVKLLHERY